MLQHPLVSVVTPTYNAADFIKETIESVQKQTYPYWEMLIVDDCSSDTTREIVKEMAARDSRISLTTLAENGGPAAARNAALSNAKGKYIAFLDSDDLWLPKKLETQVAFMNKNDLAFSFTDYRIVQETGEITETVVKAPKVVDYRFLVRNTKIGTLTVMLDAEKTGPLQMQQRRDCTEDFALWLSILKKGVNAHGLNEELALYRKCDSSVSSNKMKAAKKTWNTYRKIERIDVIRSAWYFMHYSFNAYRKHAGT